MNNMQDIYRKFFIFLGIIPNLSCNNYSRLLVEVLTAYPSFSLYIIQPKVSS